MNAENLMNVVQRGCDVPKIPVYETRLIRRGSLHSTPTVTTSKSLYEIVRPKFSGLDRESMGVLYLDAGLRPIGFKIESVGTASQCLVDVRLLMRDALLANASAIAIVHNHPSGGNKPTPADDEITRRVNAASHFIGIRFIDHLIIAERGYFSYLDSGRLEPADNGVNLLTALLPA